VIFARADHDPNQAAIDAMRLDAVAITKAFGLLPPGRTSRKFDIRHAIRGHCQAQAGQPSIVSIDLGCNAART
jgi:hypothetical protein